MRIWKLCLPLLAACAAAPLPSSEPIPAEWLSVPAATRYPALSYQSGLLTHEARKADPGPVHVDGKRLMNGEKSLTPDFAAIDSFDVSAARKEIVFSAKPKDNFDVGLVSVDGSDIHWIPPDGADEIAPQWAPRGNRVSYIIRTANGDFVRTVQVTTSAASTMEFPSGRVKSIAWEVSGEHFAVSWEAVDASDRIESMAYDGKERVTLTAPSSVLKDIAYETSRNAVIVRPEAIRYGEKLPLVVWRVADRNRWSDARAKLQREARVACAIVERDPDAAFWADMKLHPWIDLTRVFVVNAPAPPGAIGIRGDAAIESGRYRKSGNSFLVPVDVVESFAAGNIAHQLKGTPPANGRTR